VEASANMGDCSAKSMVTDSQDFLIEVGSSIYHKLLSVRDLYLLVIVFPGDLR
jgi:hypothetical protein